MSFHKKAPNNRRTKSPKHWKFWKWEKRKESLGRVQEKLWSSRSRATSSRDHEGHKVHIVITRPLSMIVKAKEKNLSRSWDYWPWSQRPIKDISRSWAYGSYSQRSKWPSPETKNKQTITRKMPLSGTLKLFRVR